jgi:hypothetical protein
MNLDNISISIKNKTLANAGYYRVPNIEHLEKIKHNEGLEVKFVYSVRIPCYICIKDLMRRRRRTKYVSKKYKLRQTTVELWGYQGAVRPTAVPAVMPGQGALHMAACLCHLQHHDTKLESLLVLLSDFYHTPGC